MDVEKLRKFVAKSHTNQIKLAAYLGYKSSVTITHWITKERIPPHQLDRVLDFIRKNS